MNQQIICSAIKQRKSVSLFYGGPRTVDPHIVYESSTGKILLDAYQTSGYSEKGETVAWKRFEIDQISNIRILETIFSVRPDYNPSNRRRYRRIICNI